MFWGLCGFILTFLFTSAKPKRKEDLYTSEDIINQKHTEKTDTPSLLNVLKDVWTILLSIICFLVFFYLGYLVMDMRHTIDKPGSFSGIMLIFFPIIPFFIAARYLPFIILGVLVLTLYDIVVCIRSKTFTKRLICKIGFLLGCLF